MSRGTFTARILEERNHTGGAMDWDTFWQVIEDALRPDPLEHAAALTARLAELKWFEIVAFQERFEEAVAAADAPDLWAAAALVNGHDSADGFRDFRAWLVGCGRATYEAALRDPDTLADVLTGDPIDGFGLEAAALRAYEQRTGMSDFYQRLNRPPRAEARAGDPAPPEESELARRFPRLAALYLVPPADGAGQ